MSESNFPKCVKLASKPSNFCPGCGHSLILKNLGFAIDEAKIAPHTVFVTDIGCSLLAWDYFDIDTFQSHHGRAAVTATGVKRALPKSTVIAYMGDGGGYAIGLHHLIHAAKRNEPMTVILVNNTVFAMTGGQMAPTTLLGMKTTTSPAGRTVETAGYPIKMADIVAMLPGTYFVTRHAVHTPNAVRYLKKAITKAFQFQKEGKGTCFIEVVSNCPSGWKMTPIQANKWLEQNMFPLYPLGDIKAPK